MSKRALITGIAGQDGSYLAEFLLGKGYEVHGIVRRESLEDRVHRLGNLRGFEGKLLLHPCTLGDYPGFYKVFGSIMPDECYHLAATSFVSYGFDDEFNIMSNNFTTTHQILSVISDLKPACRFFFAGSSEMFGAPSVSPQDEETKFNPKSIYGISKVASSHLINNYRERAGLFAVTGITYNHESVRRGFQFVTRKIASKAARIKAGFENVLQVGSLDGLRDWGYAPEYVEAFWLMLQNARPIDYVIGTGTLHSVKDILELAFGYLGMDYRDHIELNPQLFREPERVPLCANPEKINNELGWRAKKCIKEIIIEMVDAEVRKIAESKAGESDEN